MSDTDQPTPDLLKGAVVGLAAGLVASLAMDGFQRVVAALSRSDGGDEGEPATEQAADAVARALRGDELAKEDKPLGGQLVHYALGAGLGVAYGLAAERYPQTTAGFGTGFGAVTAATLDELAVPAAGLGPPPQETPASTHAYTLASHLVFGVAAEATRRLLRSRL